MLLRLIPCISLLLTWIAVGTLYLLYVHTGPMISNFICADGTQILLNQICNGAEDCPDRTDETHILCLHLICPIETFRCHYGACIKNTSLCDGHNNCADNSDESRCGEKRESCECNIVTFRCHYGACIKNTSLCDGHNNCADNSDESRCGEKRESCEITEFSCPEGKCITNEQVCNEENDCAGGADENPYMCSTTLSCPEHMYRCKHGGCVYLSKLCDGFPDCVDGSDEDSMLCISARCLGSDCGRGATLTCSPINVRRGLTVQCYSKNNNEVERISCAEPLLVGSFVTYECQEYYLPATTLENKRSVCQVDGTWDRDPLKCVPECGRSEPIAVPLIVNGWATKPDMWPWHGFLYGLVEGNWTYRCGASLFSEFAVLTAAHCVWKMNPQTLQIALGKQTKDYDNVNDGAQILNVQEVVIQPMYQDITAHYGSDIAILILKESVHFSPFVRPVCVDWNLKDVTRHLSVGSIGLSLGMGITENDTFSDHLRGVNLPVVDQTHCINSQTNDFRKYVTYTTFCAGWTNGTGVCNGDSGGGLVFSRSNNGKQWVLQGIVSISPRRIGTSFCNPRHFTIFTKVAMYVDWIRRTVISAKRKITNDTTNVN